jgi:hypothetical protein
MWEGHEFKPSLGHMVRSCLRKNHWKKTLHYILWPYFMGIINRPQETFFNFAQIGKPFFSLIPKSISLVCELFWTILKLKKLMSKFCSLRLPYDSLFYNLILLPFFWYYAFFFFFWLSLLCVVTLNAPLKTFRALPI